MHRLRSTSIGGLSGVTVAAIVFLYDVWVRHLIRWDLFAVVLTATTVKFAVLIYYRLTD